MSKIKKAVLLSFTLLTVLTASYKTQTNNPGIYCLPIFSTSPCNQPGMSNLLTNTVNDFIDNVITTGASTNIANLNSGCNGLQNNYIYYCEHFLVAHQGAVITCSVQSGALFDQSFALFVDWDQNGIFDLPAERLGASTSPPTAANWFGMTFTVPITQANGAYRMRLRCYNTPSNTLVDPCSFESVGETEDYNLYVGNSAPAQLNVQALVPSLICAGQNFNLQLNHNGTSATFVWTGPNGFTTYQQNYTFSNASPTLSGTYTIVVSDGPCTATNIAFVNVTPLPTITVNNATVCAGNQATLTASGATTYTWNVGQTTSTIAIVPVSNTTFVVIGSANSCTSTQSAVVNVTPMITLSLTSTSTLICAGSEVTISVSGADSYNWSNGSTVSTAVINPSISTVYTITGVRGPCDAEIIYTQIVEDCSSLPDNFITLNGITIFPNPFNNELTINSLVNSKAVLYNSLGQTLRSFQINSSETINTEELTPGIYFILFTTDSNRQWYKIVKN